MSGQMIGFILNACLQTMIMVFVACLLAIVFGLPLGIVLFVTGHNKIGYMPCFNVCLSMLVNATRSIPFVILMILIIPFTSWLVGTSIGTAAATVPLSLCAIPFFARLTEAALQEVPFGLIEATQAMGGTSMQLIWKVLVPESLPTLIRGATLTLITLVGYSAMAGVVGGGGLGDLAIRYGYQRFQMDVMIVTVLILIALVQLSQYMGDVIVKKMDVK